MTMSPIAPTTSHGFVRLEDAGFRISRVRSLAALLEMASQQLDDSECDAAEAIRSGAENIKDQLADLRIAIDELVSEWCAEHNRKKEPPHGLLKV